MMRILKEKFKKIKIKRKIPGGDKLKHPINKTVLIKIPIKKKLGKWCKYYEGRLPYPIECSTNKSMPVSAIYNKGKETITKDRSDCVNCKRQVEWSSWKKGLWDKVKKEIEEGADLTDIPETFNQRERE